MRAIVAVALSLLCSACGFGVGLERGAEVEFTRPGLLLDSNSRGRVSGNADAERPLVYSRSDVLEVWGPPDQKETHGDGTETWRYERSELAWRGLVLGLGLPIPLIVPVGHDWAVLRFEGDTLVSARALTDQLAFCGYFASDESTKWGC